MAKHVREQKPVASGNGCGQGGRLAGRTGEKHRPPGVQVRLHPGEDAVRLTLCIFRRPQRSDVRTGFRPFMPDEERPVETGAVNHTAGSGEGIHQVVTGRTAGTAAKRLGIPAADSVGCRLFRRKGIAPQDRFLECAHLLAAATTDADILRNGSIPESHRIRLHRNGLHGADPDAGAATAAQ